MKKTLMILAAVFMVLSFSMVGFAYYPNVAGTTITPFPYYGYYPNVAGTTGTSYQAKADRLAMCGPGEMYTGAVAWVDPDAQRMMVNGRDGSKIFDVSRAVIKGMPETDHFVTVKYTVANGERFASSVSMVPKSVASLYVWAY